MKVEVITNLGPLKKKIKELEATNEKAMEDIDIIKADVAQLKEDVKPKQEPL